MRRPPRRFGEQDHQGEFESWSRRPKVRLERVRDQRHGQECKAAASSGARLPLAVTSRYGRPTPADTCASVTAASSGRTHYAHTAYMHAHLHAAMVHAIAMSLVPKPVGEYTPRGRTRGAHSREVHAACTNRNHSLCRRTHTHSRGTRERRAHTLSSCRHYHLPYIYPDNTCPTRPARAQIAVLCTHLCAAFVQHSLLRLQLMLQLRTGNRA